MIEPGSRFECFIIMTDLAFSRKGALVVIRMTAQTRGIQTQVGWIFFVFYFLISDKLRFMAVFTFFPAMGTSQFIAGKVMVKLFFFKADDLKVSPVVVIMANHAGFTL
jgi:hypothetical protein